MEHAEDFIWRGDGEEAEVVVYAPDAEAARRGFERASRAASLPGAEGPVYAAVSVPGYGHAVSSSESVSPEMASAPERGLLLSCEAPGEDFARRLGVAGHQAGREVARRVGEAMYGLPRMNASAMRRVCEVGAEVAASEGVIEEEDLAFLDPLPGDPDSAGRRALLAGEREWGQRFADIDPFSIIEVLDSDALEGFGVEPEGLLIGLSVGAGEMGRIAFSLHRERIAHRILSRDFDHVPDPSGGGASLCIAPFETEEAQDFVAASGTVSNFADALAALSLLVVRRALGGVVGEMEVRSAWRSGGVGITGEGAAHRYDLASSGDGDQILSGGALCSGTGAMRSSAPMFPVEGPDGLWPWEEAGLLGRIARLGPPG